MFGESESESPRVGSPWDALLSLSSSPARSRSRTPSNSDLSGESETELKRVNSDELPKLVPEAEAGNVEYKLQLISPTPERFLRLVTQLKWRLLEGGGQAYYELGVADSGQLVGLTRANLEKSLETLDAMAGEIGASVIVVKEIEVPERYWEQAARDGGVNIGNGATKSFASVKDSPPATSLDVIGTRKKPFRTRPTAWGAVEVLNNSSKVLESEEEDIVVLEVPSPPSPSSPEDDGVFHFDLEISEVFKPFRSKNPSPAPSLQFGLKKEKKEKPPFPKKKTQQDKSAGKKTRRDDSRLGQGKGCPKLESATLPEIATPLKELQTLHVPLQETTSAATTISALKNDPVVEPRMIVEALVVRKLSTEEVFLDFGGFDLAD